jgi:hypothetical protein
MTNGLALRIATLIVSAPLLLSAAPFSSRHIFWDDIPASIQRRLHALGVDGASFTAFREDHQRRTQARVVEGDLDALVYYALQSTAFTRATPIEPALSAKAFVERLDDESRRRYLAGEAVGTEGIPAAVRQRLIALLGALRDAPAQTRLDIFRDIVVSQAPSESRREAFLAEQYVRAMRFLYEKEFVAQRTSAEAVAALYRERGLSTDTAVEAGYLVHHGLATLHALDPSRRIRRVLIVGPGLDLAPRTGLIEAGPPESYQPFAVVDSLISLGLSRLDDLVVVGADVNPRVVERLEGASKRGVSLTLVTGVADGGGVTLEREYRDYFDAVGRSIADPMPPPALPARYDGHLRKAMRVRPQAVRVVSGLGLDIATDRIDFRGDGPFDLIVATNVLPYLDDRLLSLALANVSAMLAPGGVFMHNESRGVLGDLARDLDLPPQQARTAVIATVRGAAPLSDAVVIHEKKRP